MKLNLFLPRGIVRKFIHLLKVKNGIVKRKSGSYIDKSEVSP
jgi:hypothetical protein